MANAALFIGYGTPIAGREQKSLQVFSEAIQYYTQLQQRGEIESFEPVYLEPHGGDLSGFILLRGDRDKLERARYTEEFSRLTTRAGLVVQNIGIVGAYIGEEQSRLFADFAKQTADLT